MFGLQMLQVLVVLLPVVAVVAWAFRSFETHFPGCHPPFTSRGIAFWQSRVNARLVDLFIEMHAHFEVEKALRDGSAGITWTAKMMARLRPGLERAKQEAWAAHKVAGLWGFVVARKYRTYVIDGQVWPVEVEPGFLIDKATRVRGTIRELRRELGIEDA